MGARPGGIFDKLTPLQGSDPRMTADDNKRRHTVKMAPPSSRAQREAPTEQEALDPDGPTQSRRPAPPKAKRRLQGQLLAGLVCTDDGELGAFRRLRLGLDATVSDAQLALLREHLRLAALALHDPEAPFWQGLDAFDDSLADEATPPESRTDPQLKTDPFLRLPKARPPRSSAPPPSEDHRTTRQALPANGDASPSTERTPAVVQRDEGYGYGPVPMHGFGAGATAAATMAMTPAGGAPAVSSHTPLGGVARAHGGPMSAPVPSSGVHGGAPHGAAGQHPPGPHSQAAPEAPPSGGGEDDPWVRPWGQPYAPQQGSSTPSAEPQPASLPPHRDGYQPMGHDPSYDGIPPYHDPDASYDAIPPTPSRDLSYGAIPPPGAPPPGAPPPGYPPAARGTNPGIAPPDDAYPTASPSEPTYPHRSSHPEPSPPPAPVQGDVEPTRLDPIVSLAHGLALSVEEYAALCAERDYQGPHAHEATQARYDVHSPASWEATRQAFALRFSRDQALRHQWEQAYYRFTAHLRHRG